MPFITPILGLKQLNILSLGICINNINMTYKYVNT